MTVKKIRAKSVYDLTESDISLRENTKYAVQILNFNIWFDYKKAREIFKDFDIAYLQAYNYFQNPENNGEIRPLNFYFSGDMNSGKTTCVTKYMNYCEKMAELEGLTFSKYDIMYFETPVRVTFKQMFASLLGTKFGMSIKGRALNSIHTNSLIDNISEELREHKVKLLFIDEIQNLIKADKEDKRDIFDGFKRLVNQSQTRIILVGTSDVIDLFQGSDMVMERFRLLTLPRWKEDSEYIGLLTSLHHAYGDFLPDWDLLTSDGKVNKTIGEFLYQKSEGRLGKLIQMIRYGAVTALLNGRTNISKSDYLSVFKVEYKVNGNKISTKPKLK